MLSFSQQYALKDESNKFSEAGMKIFNNQNLKIKILFYNHKSQNIHVEFSSDVDSIFKRFLFLIRAISRRSDQKWYINECLTKVAQNLRGILGRAKEKSLIHSYIVSASGSSITFNKLDGKSGRRHEIPICDPVSQLLVHVALGNSGKISYDPWRWAKVEKQECEDKAKASRGFTRFYNYALKRYVIAPLEFDPRGKKKGQEGSKRKADDGAGAPEAGKKRKNL